jgi:hypothetical protein
MKNIYKLILIGFVTIFVGCDSNKYHPNTSVNKTGSKSHKESQKKLASDYGGVNHHAPNSFKKKHF